MTSEDTAPAGFTQPVGVVVDDDSGSSAVPADIEETLGRLTGFLYARMHLDSAVELTVTLVDDARMEQLHLEWMDLPGPTDVLSLPMDELRPGTASAAVTEGMLGDVVISPEVARRQAAAAGHDVSDELALLTVHGVLHLLGHDHVEAEERRTMFELQASLLEGFLGRAAPTPTVDDS
ncbi:rRNA maturation RNase YbeY [Nesterenkonia xinjiangensis]|uniref:Endoribonuclease YbeY n=1 Tax=Nesterenkonia xinjiangensis TaxID=225327 RepID=A0A7Z0GQV0_9MICC|nr:rRNA maturation RNase YbeY [Nesterenkonia xinjiangensis]NYJ79438.1 putative rRNA maturation factor [Nesterenkonia xinjiangensis]